MEAKNIEIFEQIKKCIPQWEKFNPNNAVIERMTGITNQTYKVSHPSDSNPVIYRKFGESSQNVFLDREVEALIYKHISDEGLGPKIYGYGKGIRVQSFIFSEVLKTEEMLKKGYLQRVAYTLRQFHNMKEPGIVKKSLFERVYFSESSTIIEKAQNKLNKPIFDENEKQNVKILQEWVTKDEISFLKKITQPLQKQKLVFSHNDLLANNVLIRNGDKRAVFIDYEYSCFNYAIFDIANFFNETQYDYDVAETPFFGVIPDYPEKQSLKERFMKFYCLANQNTYEKYMKKVQKEEIQLSQKQGQEYQKLKSFLKVGQMLSNVMWGWWGIIVSKNPQINFDYIEFCMKRYKDYMKAKKQIESDL